MSHNDEVIALMRENAKLREALKDMIEITEDIPHYAQRARAALAQSPAGREE